MLVHVALAENCIFSKNLSIFLESSRSCSGFGILNGLNLFGIQDESRFQSTGRAYPDISAQSVDYVIAYDSAFYLVSGTSASSPAVAGMISMINYGRLKVFNSMPSVLRMFPEQFLEYRFTMLFGVL